MGGDQVLLGVQGGAMSVLGGALGGEQGLLDVQGGAVSVWGGAVGGDQGLLGVQGGQVQGGLDNTSGSNLRQPLTLLSQVDLHHR